MKPLLTKLLISLSATIFGLATITAGGSVIFFNDGAFGRVIPWVVWFNFFSGFIYVAASLYVWIDPRVAYKLSVYIFITTSVIFVLLGIHIASGLAYEKRTVAAMGFRWIVWAVISLIGYYVFVKNQADNTKL